MKVGLITKSRMLISGAALIAMLIAAYILFGSASSKPVGYTFVALKKGTLESTISCTGTLSPVTQVDVGTQVSGTVNKVLVDFNDRIMKGQIIAVIDTSLLKLTVTEAQSGHIRAEAQFAEAQLNYKRSEELSQKGMLSESDFQTVKTSYRTAQAALISARAQLDRARQNLKYAIIRSPINGTVTARNVEPGQTVAASFATPTLFTIAQDLSKMEIRALVDESDIGEIKEGQAARFTVQAYPDRKFEGAVKQVRVQPTTASNVVNYTVVISAENKERVLLPGMTATVDFIIAQKKGVLLVANAALRFQPSDDEKTKALRRLKGSTHLPDATTLQHGADYVKGSLSSNSSEWKQLWFLDKDGALSFVPVATGINDGTNTEILGEQFQEGMKVISGRVSADQEVPSKGFLPTPPQNPEIL